MVDVAVRLGEVAVTVVVVSVPLVEARQVAVELGVGLARRLLRRVPPVQLVLEQTLDVPDTDDRAAVVRAVRRLVEGHLHRVGDVAVHGVAVLRLLLVEVPHRDLPGCIVEEQIQVVSAVEVRRPDRRVVVCPVRLRDRVVERARGAGMSDVPERPVIMGCRLVAELAQNRPDRVFTQPLELDVLALRDLRDLSGGLAL